MHLKNRVAWMQNVSDPSKAELSMNKDMINLSLDESTYYILF